VQGVLFDLDGTLLDIDLGDFLSRYFDALGPVISEITGLDAATSLDAVMRATEQSCLPHPGRTNEAVWAEHFAELTNRALGAADWLRIARFYEDDFPALQASALPRDGGRAAVEAARRIGARVALATNPIFPRAAIVERMRWAGITPDDVDVVTTYETMHACKPLPGYFSQTAALLGVDPSECLMVGDDPVLDMAAADVGMRTFFVGSGPIPPTDYAGDLRDLASLLERLSD